MDRLIRLTRQFAGVFFVATLLASVYVARADAATCAVYFNYWAGVYPYPVYYEYEACYTYASNATEACDEMRSMCDLDCTNSPEGYAGGETAACSPYEEEGQYIISNYLCACVW